MRYSRAADKCTDAIRATGAKGILPVHLTGPDHLPPQVMEDRLAMGALADSYYEYLLKQWLQSPSETRFKDSWLEVMNDLPALVRPQPEGSNSSNFKLIELAPNGLPIWKMDHLSCFVPGMIALGLMSLPERRNEWLPLAEGLASSCVQLWTNTKSGLAPEYVLVDASNPSLSGITQNGGQHSFLRPETAESLFYLFRLTGDTKYRRWGKKLFRSIVTHSKVDAGFASVHDVNEVPTRKMDEMQSFVMAETFKYLFLLFSPADRLELDHFVLNTEGHPFRKLAPW